MVAAVLILGAIMVSPILVVAWCRKSGRAAQPIITNHTFGIFVSILLVVGAVFLSLRYGALEMSWSTVLNALVNFDETNHEHLIVRELRWSRTILGLVAGSSLAVAGALTQGVTRNPLGDPGILGINAGATFAIVTAIYAADIVTPKGYVWFAFLGALVALVLVYAIARVGSGGATPVKLALAGVITTALLGGWTSSILILDEETFDEARFWLAGSISSRGTEEISVLYPLIILGLLVGVSMGRQINILNLGDETATSLGQRTAVVRICVGAVVVLLCGSAVAIAGPLAFVGLAIPHMVRSLVGADYRWILIYSFLLGPCLVLGADVTGRVIMRPEELQVGIVTAAVGAPFLIYLVRFTRLSEV